MSGGVNMATVLKRLEAVTSRLEDLYEGVGKAPTAAAPASIAPVPPPGAIPAPPSAPAVQVQSFDEPPSVVAYEKDILDGKVKPFVKLTESFASPVVIEEAKLVELQYTNIGGFIRMAALCKRPNESTFRDLALSIQKDVDSIVKLKDANWKERDWANHLSTVSEGSGATGWVLAENKPGSYVSEAKDSAQFYGNRVIQEFKSKDPKHVEWVKAYLSILEDLKKYVVAHHTNGLMWNPKGISVEEYKATNKSTPTAGGAPPPPPPPPPPPALVTPAASSSAPPAGGAAAVFAELNRGEEVTKGLRKVDKSEMTHKNPSLRAGSTVPARAPSPNAPKKPLKPTKPHALAGKKPSKFALEGNKWMIEYQENESALTVGEAELSHTVNLFGCKNTTVLVKGKVNAVTMVNCSKTSVLVESVISSISVTNSPSFALQITGSAPTIQLDTTDSGQIYLSKDCLGVEITTAKCSSINVSLPVEGEEDGVFEEQAVPEMLKTTIKNGKLVTTVVEHVG
ncbi:cyclase-associated protein [Dentipellis sp. KUC8613]|nr:cyclase-associated protein [Dentipellis sp. KUC8613]